MSEPIVHEALAPQPPGERSCPRCCLRASQLGPSALWSYHPEYVTCRGESKPVTREIMDLLKPGTRYTLRGKEYVVTTRTYTHVNEAITLTLLPLEHTLRDDLKGAGQ